MRRIPQAAFWIRCAVALCFGLAACLAGDQLWLASKAALAERLIERAYRQHRIDGESHRPWPWADTGPLARLSVPRLAVDRIVLAGASGSSLAFGPGHVDGTALPNDVGLSAIAGHRDGAFAFLERLAPGDLLILETRTRTTSYRVLAAEAFRFDDATVLAQASYAGGELDKPTLKLITCWPFGARLPGPLRWVVTLEAEGFPIGTANPACFRSGGTAGLLGSREHVEADQDGPGLGCTGNRRLQRVGETGAPGTDCAEDVCVPGWGNAAGFPAQFVRR